MASQPESVRSYRELLRYVLQEFQSKGGRLTLPVGCYHVEDWLLDAINVSKLLSLFETEREVNLVQACEGTGGSGSLLNAPGPLAQGVISAGQEAAPAAATQTQQQKDGDCELQLPLPKTGLSESELKDLAYVVFVGSCSGYCTELLSDDVRRTLQISHSAAMSLQALLMEAAQLQSQAASSQEMLVMLLQIARPRHFEGFEGFVAWRQSSAAAICQSLALGAAEAASGDAKIQSQSMRRELQRLKMSLRMLDFSVAEEFEESVYSEATKAFVTAAGGVARLSGLGWGLPWPIRVRIAELLMAAGFDSSQEGTPIPEQQQLVHVLRHHLWPLLGLPLSLHDMLNAWAYLRQFVLTGNAGLLVTGRDLIEAVGKRRKGGMNGRRASGLSVSSRDSAEAFIDAVISAAVEWIAARLSNYRQNFEGDAGPIPGLLEVLAACLRCLHRTSELPQILEDCIGASIHAEFQRNLQVLSESRTGVPKDADRVMDILRSCNEILDEEVAFFAPLFSSHITRPAELAAMKVHQCLKQHLLPWLQTVHTLEDSNLEAIREAVGIESKLQSLIGERISEGLDWDIVERLTPLLHLWVSKQLSLVQSWYERIFATETWQATSQPRGCCRSAVELVKIVRETLEALFDLHLGLPDEVVVAAGAGLDNYLQQFAQQTAAELGSPDFMIPPVPALTRYKKDVAKKAAAADAARQPRGAEGGARGTREQEQLANGPSMPLIVRINSLHYIRSHLQSLADIISSRWGAPEGENALWAETIFDNTRTAVAHSVDCIVHFAATKAVHRDLAEAFEALYKHEVAQSRIGPLLEALDDQLGNLCSVAEPEVHGLLARGLLQAALDAILRVLLHGGPNRWFKPQDVPMVEEDLEDLRALFHAEGEGLDEADITGMCASVNDLLTVLELDTGVLIDNLKQVRQLEKAGRLTGQRTLADNSQVLLHVLAHREDHAASKYLKKEFALPKRLDSGTSLTGGLGALSSLSSGLGWKESGAASAIGRKFSFVKFSRK